MKESKIKYLKILKSQYNTGRISKNKYDQEIIQCRGRRSFVEILLNIFK